MMRGRIRQIARKPPQANRSIRARLRALVLLGSAIGLGGWWLLAGSARCLPRRGHHHRISIPEEQGELPMPQGHLDRG